MDSIRARIFLPEVKNGEPSWSVKEINKIAACILEPIQGEGGIHPLMEDFVRSLREEADRMGFLLIFDEIQAGLYRTGFLSSGAHLSICADLYCFSKGLGGGVVKIAAMLARKDRYAPRFGFLHTSTFAEDSFSSALAGRVLGILNPRTVENGMRVTEQLKRGLMEIQKRYPAVIKEVRGRGFLLGIEFQSSIRDSCYEFKFFCDVEMIGYLFSSGLLHHEDLRVNPTLSSPLTLRLEPSLFTTEEEVSHICRGLEHLCEAISSLNMDYFFGHMFPGCRIGPAHRVPEGVIQYDKGSKPSAVFLSHVIQPKDAGKIFHALKDVPSEMLEDRLKGLFELLEFEIYFRTTLKGDNGGEVDAIIMALPLSSGVIRELYKSDRSHILCEKIQNAVAYAKELGASTVGLGQFTSIVTRNGLCLDPLGLNITTGNGYTVALMIEATLQLARQKGINMEETHIGFVGAAGNIVSVSATILSGHCRKVSFFYHTTAKASNKLTRVLLDFIRQMVFCRSAADSVSSRISKLLPNGTLQGKDELLSFLDRHEVKEILGVETDLERLRQCDIILTGTNTAETLIEPSFLKQGAVIVDAGVPGDVPARLREIRPDVTVIKGGIAGLPRHNGRLQTIFLPSFPLKEGQAFGCMSETFGIGLSGVSGIYHVGGLSRQIVEKAKAIAEAAGFHLCEYKKVKTFDF